MSENEIEDNIDQMRKLLSNIQSSESDIQIINNLQEMNKLSVISAVLRITGAGRQVETLRKHKGKVGELSSALVEKWNQDVRVETQMRIEAAKKVLPGDLSGADVEIVKEVTANMYGSSGYETLNKIGFAIINQDSDFYQLLLFRPEQSTITLVNISRSFIFFVHQNQVISFTDEGNIRWRVVFDSQDDLNNFAKRLLLCKAMCGEEEVVSTDLVIGEGRGAELGDSLEVQMVVWEVGGIFLNKPIEKKRLKFKLGGKNRFFSLKKNFVGMKKGGRRFLIPSTNSGRTAYDIKVCNVNAVNAVAATATGINEPAATAEDDADDGSGFALGQHQPRVLQEDVSRGRGAGGGGARGVHEVAALPDQAEHQHHHQEPDSQQAVLHVLQQVREVHRENKKSKKLRTSKPATITSSSTNDTNGNLKAKVQEESIQEKVVETPSEPLQEMDVDKPTEKSCSKKSKRGAKESSVGDSMKAAFCDEISSPTQTSSVQAPPVQVEVSTNVLPLDVPTKSKKRRKKKDDAVATRIMTRKTRKAFLDL